VSWLAWASTSQRRPWEILKASGVDPTRRSGPIWPQFPRSQAEAVLACDFFTAGLLDGTQAYVLAVIEHATRRIHILGVTLHPTGQWTAQQAVTFSWISATRRTGQVHDPRPRIKLHRRVRRNPRRRWHPNRAVHNQHRPHRFLNGAAPLKPLPEPVDLDLYRIRKHAQVGGLINEYHLVA
jgi:hypothetical protein